MRRFTFLIVLISFLNSTIALGNNSPSAREITPAETSPAPVSNDPSTGAAPAVGNPAEASSGPAAQAEQKIEQFKSSIASLEPQDVKTQLTTAAEDCKSALSMAKNACLESLSPHIQSGMAILSAGMSALQAASGSKDSCEKSNGLMDGAQKAMTAYNGACGGLKMMCNSKCAKSKTTASSAKASCAKAPQNQQAECQKKTAEGEAAFGQGVAACNDFQKNLAAGIAALAGILGNMQKSKSCEKDVAPTTVDCAANPSDPKCVAANANLDCNKAENASNPRCICEKSPRMAGCTGAANVPTTEVNVGDGTTSSVKGDDGVGSIGSGGEANEENGAMGSSLGAGGGGGLPGAGGGGSGGGAGKGMSGTDGGGKKDGKPVNTNILSGEYGGGGGGRSGGGGSDDGAKYGKYAGFLPKNARGLAGKNDSPVTGGNGLTNWQKVNIRYKENKQTLLNNQ